MKRIHDRKGFLIAISVLVLILATGCTASKPAASTATGTTEVAATGAASTATTAPAATVTLPTFTAEQLATYDGKDGHSAYIAVDGKVYDVTNVAQWKNGTHAGRFQAGADYTEALKNAPHSAAMLGEAPVVGLYQP